MFFWEEDTNLEKSEKITEKIKEKSGKKCYFSSQRSEFARNKKFIWYI